MNPTNYGLHETLEVHELAAFKTLCMTKAKAMKLLVSDQELKQILLDDIEVSTRQLQELSHVLSNSELREMRS